MRKIISVLLAVLIFGVQAVSGSNNSDIAGGAHEDAMKLLEGLGIINVQNVNGFEANKETTRAEMTLIILRALGMDNVTYGRDIFKDVTKEHEAYAYITAAYDMGIVNGSNEDLFEPESSITLSQAVKMVVSALGYDVQAQAMGGYPAGYLAKASALGILSGISNDHSLTMDEMCQIMVKAIDVPLFERTSYGKGYTFIESDNTILTKYLGIKKYEGIVMADEFSNLAGGSGVKKGCVLIGNNFLDTGISNAEDYLGQKVIAYAKHENNNDIGVIIYVSVNSNCKKVIVAADNILSTSVNSRLYYINSSGNEDTAEIAGAVLIYNGRMKTSWTIEDIMISSGEVTLIAPAGNTVEYIMVTQYEDYIVESKNTEENMVYFKYGVPEMKLDRADPSVKTIFKDYDGREAFVENLKEWNILSVARSADNQVVKIIVSNYYEQGEITEISNDEVKINGNSFKIANSLLESTGADKPKLGQSGKYYLNFLGEISAVDKRAFADTKYGYLVGGLIEKGLDGVSKVKIFTQDGEMKIFGFADNILCNNEIVSGGKVLLPSDTNTLVNDVGNIIEQVVRYKENIIGNLVQLDTAVNGEGLSQSEREDKFTLDRRVNGSAGFIGHGSKMFLTKYLLREGSIVFSVPSEYDGANDKDYRVIDYNSIPHVSDGGTYTNAEFYDITEDNVISLFIIPEKEAVVKGDSEPGIITNVAKGLNESGDLVTKIELFNKAGETIKLYAEDDTEIIAGTSAITDITTESQLEGGNMKNIISADKLEKGDVIQYISSVSGEMTAAKVLFRANAAGAATVIPVEKAYGEAIAADTYAEYDYSALLYVYAKAAKPMKYGVKLYVPYTRNNTSNILVERTHLYSKEAKILLFDIKKQTLKAISADIINEDDRIFALRQNTNQRFVIVYR